MKKQIIFALLAVVALIGCQKKQPIDLKTTSDEMFTRTHAKVVSLHSLEEQEAVIANMMDSMYILLEQNMGAPYSDTLFIDLCNYFTREQQDHLFDLMPDQMRNQENIVCIYDYLHREPVEIGGAYVDFKGLTPEGKELFLHELVGKTDYVLIDFWASWCGPCRRLIPVLKDMYVRMPAGKLQIFSCSVDQEEADWRQALSEENMPWPQVIDQIDNAGELYEVEYIPYTVLIDKQGNIVAINPDEADLEIILLGE